MAIVQQASGTFAAATTFTPTLPAASNSANLVVIFVGGNTVVTTPASWTLRTSQVNLMGHYLYERAGVALTSVAITCASGEGTWWIAEIEAGVYGLASSQNDSASASTYSTLALTPTAGERLMLASLGSVSAAATARTITAWTSSYVEQADILQSTVDWPMQGVAKLDLAAADGTTAYSTTGTYSGATIDTVGRSAIGAWYQTTSGVPGTVTALFTGSGSLTAVVTGGDPPPIALREAGATLAAAVAVTAISPLVPASATTGDLSVLGAGGKPFGVTFTDPSTWTKVGETTNGTTANGVDVGSTKVAVWTKESAATGAIGNMTIGGTPNTIDAVINTYSKDPAKVWDVTQFTTGGDTANGANFSATGAGGIAVATGDWVVAVVSVNGDIGTASAIAIGGMAGATLGTTQTRTNHAVTTGNDTRLIVADVPVTAGSSSAAPTLTYTNASSQSGSVVWLRLRQVQTSSSVTALFTGTGTLTAAVAAVVPVTAPFTGSGTLTAPAISTKAAAAAFSGDGALTAPAIPVGTATVGFTGSGALTAGVVPRWVGDAPFTATGTLTAAASPVVQVTAPFAGTGVLSAALLPVVPAAVPFTGDGTFSVEIQGAINAVFTGSGTLTASVVKVSSATVAFTGSGTLAAAVVPLTAMGASFTGSGTLTADVAPSSAVTAPLTGAGALTAEVSPVAAAAASFSGTGTLTAVAVEAAPVTALFTGTGTLTAAAVPVKAVAAAFTGSGTLSAAVIKIATLTIAQENALTGNASSQWAITGAGDLTNLGFARQFSVNIGETVQFSCSGTGTVIDIYRVGYYAGNGSRKVATITNTATSQPAPTTVANTNGGTTCTAWSVTASWAVPADATTGFYVAVLNNVALTNASWIPFVVRDDARVADIIVKVSDTTWGVAYSPFGTMASPISGKSYYDSNGFNNDTGNRSHHGTYHKPIITRQGRDTTYWRNGEHPVWMWLERNGYNIKYISSRDMDRNPTCLDNGSIFLSNSHDEYWSQPMHDAAVAFRDSGRHLVFMSANEHFWRVRYTDDDNVLCYKDTMPGPGAHVAGVALDPVTWTGTWKDTRTANNATRAAENTLTGTDFRMNGDRDDPAPFDAQASWAAHVVWRNTLIASGTDVTVNGVIGYEADRMLPTRAGPATLAAYSYNIDGWYADNDGQNYTGNGTLTWGVVAQRWPSGAAVIGFGTTQWGWGLDNAHDRGTAVANVTMQQFTYNLFRDLGAAPSTLMAGLTASSPQPLTNYGALSAVEVTALFTGSGTLTATTVPKVAVVAAFTATGVLSAAVSAVVPADAPFTGTGTLAAPAVSVKAVTAPLSGDGTLTAVATAVVPVTAPLTGSGSLAAAVAGSVAVTAAFTGIGALTAAVTPSVAVAATFSGAGALTATVSQRVTFDAAFTGSGTLTAIYGTVGSLSVTAPFSGTGTLTTAATTRRPVTASFTADGGLSAAISTRQSVTALFAGAGALAAAASATVAVSAPFSGAGSLTADALSAHPVVASFAGAGALGASVVASVPVTADFSGVGTLTAAASVGGFLVDVSFSGVGTLTTTVLPQAPVVAAFGGAGSLTATLSAIRPVTAAFTGSGSLTAVLGFQLDNIPGSVTVGGPRGTDIIVGSPRTLTKGE